MCEQYLYHVKSPSTNAVVLLRACPQQETTWVLERRAKTALSYIAANCAKSMCGKCDLIHYNAGTVRVNGARLVQPLQPRRRFRMCAGIATGKWSGCQDDVLTWRRQFVVNLPHPTAQAHVSVKDAVVFGG